MSDRAAKRHIAIVGAGPGGLTAAMILSHRGFRVTVLEAEDHVGGRNAAIRLGPYTFDTGPTFLMLREILDEVFAEAGARTDDLLDVRRIEPMYRLQFRDKAFSPTGDAEAMKTEIGRVFPGREHAYEPFMAVEKRRFEKLYPCLQKSYHRIGDLFSRQMIRALPHLSLGRSLFDVMQGHFGDEQLALAFTFQAKYIGMSPWECPGLFGIVAYIEHSRGIHHPIGGLSRISDAMADTARRGGAQIRLSSPVEQILVENRSARGVRLRTGEVVEADDVVINADFGHAATHLFAPGVLRKYTPERLRSMRVSCSTFMLYLGLDVRYDTPHHMIVFADDYRRNVTEIFGGIGPSKDTSFYVRNADVTDDRIAPPGHSAVYVLVPVPNTRSGIDWQTAGPQFRETVLDAIEARTPMRDIRRHIREEKVITPADWENTHRVYAGATFNLAHNVTQMIYFRPRNRFEELDHCYLVGGGTHPGSGLPTIYESGRITANLLSRHYRVPFQTHNLEA